MKERKYHINLMELKAGFLALQVFAAQGNKAYILIRINGTTAIAYLNKRGGTHTQKLSDLAIRVWEMCLTRNPMIQAEHIPGRENREGGDISNWMLYPGILQELNSEVGQF